MITFSAHVGLIQIFYYTYIFFVRYEEHLINIWLVLLQNYPEAVVLGNDYLVCTLYSWRKY